ncbi:hypothetical protein LINPERHAP2_LOCUS11338, partial [Linum perenne]
MRYIGVILTVVAIVFPLVILYKLWNTKRDSETNNVTQQLDSTCPPTTSLAMSHSENNANNTNNNINQQLDSTS